MDITNGVDMTLAFKEYVQFGDFDSRDYNMRLVERSAPAPAEKSKTESVPFMHGHYDFGSILGERLFENRPIRYTFHVNERDVDRRKHTQTVLENRLTREGITTLVDTYSPNYFYKGKATSVSTTDDHVYKRLVIQVEFDCYPFKVSQTAEGYDIWDTFNFELDVMQDVEYQIAGTDAVTLINPGTPSVSPEVTTTSEMTVQFENQLYTFPAGTSKNEALRLHSGENTLIITGSGTINFSFYKELI